jgi:CRP/FNR family transcriptional regulator, cyclic AMP receptor protein
VGDIRLTLSDEGVLDVATDPMDIVFLLKSVPLFAGLSGEQLLPVADIVQRVDYEKGQVVFEQGQPGSHVYLVLEGSVEVLHDGERVAVLGAKECFGEMALLDSGARSASIRTLADTSLWAIAREDFQDLLDLHPALAKGVIRVLTHRLRDATDQQAASSDAKAA